MTCVSKSKEYETKMKTEQEQWLPIILPVKKTLADGEVSWSLLPRLVYLLSGGTVEPENI